MRRLLSNFRQTNVVEGDGPEGMANMRAADTGPLASLRERLQDKRTELGELEPEEIEARVEEKRAELEELGPEEIEARIAEKRAEIETRIEEKRAELEDLDQEEIEARLEEKRAEIETRIEEKRAELEDIDRDEIEARIADRRAETLEAGELPAFDADVFDFEPDGSRLLQRLESDDAMDRLEASALPDDVTSAITERREALIEAIEARFGTETGTQVTDEPDVLM